MAITIWEWTGLTFVLYYAAMSQIDQSMLEAARIDGANNLRILVSVIWPNLRGTTVALGILSAIGALKTFDIPWLVTIAGPNNSTQFLGTYIYQMTITLAHVGYGAALSIILLVVALALAIILQIVGREREGDADVRGTHHDGARSCCNSSPRCSCSPTCSPSIAMVQGSLAGDGWGNYRDVLAVPGFFRFFVNSAIISAAVIAIVYVVTMLAAFGFAKLHIRGREIYFWLLLACLTLPEVVLLTPLFTTTQALGLFNTYWAVVLPLAALQVPFAVLLTRNFISRSAR